jgi:hypothetical protein
MIYLYHSISVYISIYIYYIIIYYDIYDIILSISVSVSVYHSIYHGFKFHHGHTEYLFVYFSIREAGKFISLLFQFSLTELIYLFIFATELKEKIRIL